MAWQSTDWEPTADSVQDTGSLAGAWPAADGEHSVTGKRRQKWRSGYRTKRAAGAALVELTAAVQAGTYVEPNRQSLAEFLDDWLAACTACATPGPRSR